MKLHRALSVLLAAAGSLAIMGVGTSFSASAYTVVPNGRTAGNPSGQPLQDIILNSNDVGRTLDPTVWSLSAGTSNDDGETLTQSIVGRAIIKVLDLTADTFSLKFDLSNLTDTSYQAAILSLFFGVTPDITGYDFQSGSTFNSVRFDPNGNAPGGFKNVDICVFAANNCNGGNINNGLQAGQSDSFTLSLFGDFRTNTDGFYRVTISDLGTKWQTQDGSYQIAGVPEPMTILGSGMAAGFGLLMKRESAKRKRKDEEKSKAVV